MPQQVYQMNTVVQFIVLKREGKWVVKSKCPSENILNPLNRL